MSLLLNADASPERVLELREQVRAWLAGHPKVRPDGVEVSVNRLGGQGVEIILELCLVDVSTAGENEFNCELLRLSEGPVRREAGRLAA